MAIAPAADARGARARRAGRPCVAAWDDAGSPCGAEHDGGDRWEAARWLAGARKLR